MAKQTTKNETKLELVHQYVALLKDKSSFGDYQKATVRFQEEMNIGMLGWAQTVDWKTIAEKLMEDTQDITFTLSVGELKELIAGKEDDEDVSITQKYTWTRYATYPKAPLNDITKQFGDYQIYDKVDRHYE